MPAAWTVDGHVHTSACGHARGEMEEYVQAAVAGGLAGIIFLEHYETGIHGHRKTWLSEAEFDAYLAEGRRLRRQYAGRIRVGLGVEVGYHPERLAAIKAFLRRHAWDRIGISYHYYRIGRHHYNLLSRRPANLAPLEAHGLSRVLAEYFAGIEEAVAELPGTTVCHLDAALRYHSARPPLDGFRERIENILALIRRQGMALEINTAGFALRGEPFPAREIVQRAMAMNIPLVAGSDAHQPSEVGRYFERLAGWLAKAGRRSRLNPG